MSLIRRVARPMLATMFVVGGLDQLRHPASGKAKVGPLRRAGCAPLRLPNDPELLVRANGAAMVGGGRCWRRVGCRASRRLVLAASLVPTTYVGHRSGRSRTRPSAPAAHRLPEEPRPARRSAARGRRHRGPPRSGLPEAHGQPVRRPHREDDQARGQARCPELRAARPGYAARAARREAKLAASQAAR